MIRSRTSGWIADAPHSVDRKRRIAPKDRRGCWTRESDGFYRHHISRRQSFVTRPGQCLVASSVQAVVILQVGSVADLLNPAGVGSIPFDGLRQAFAEADGGGPVPFTLDLRTVNRVSTVVAGTILHELYQRLRLAQKSKNL